MAIESTFADIVCFKGYLFTLKNLFARDFDLDINQRFFE